MQNIICFALNLMLPQNTTPIGKIGKMLYFLRVFFIFDILEILTPPKLEKFSRNLDLYKSGKIFSQEILNFF